MQGDARALVILGARFPHGSDFAPACGEVSAANDDISPAPWDFLLPSRRGTCVGKHGSIMGDYNAVGGVQLSRDDTRDGEQAVGKRNHHAEIDAGPAAIRHSPRRERRPATRMLAALESTHFSNRYSTGFVCRLPRMWIESGHRQPVHRFEMHRQENLPHTDGPSDHGDGLGGAAA